MKHTLLNDFSNHELSSFFSQTSGNVWLGLSGGLDSMVLLHLLVFNVCANDAVLLKRLKVIHIHHGLSPNADHWLQECETLCQQYKLHFEAHKVCIEHTSQSIEEAARIARYHVFSQQVQKNDLLLLAHHANDQMETVLFRLLRGTGGKGLGGIPKARVLVTATGKAQLLRPLLPYSKNALMDYAKHHKLVWVEDESNTDTQYARNFIRHNIVPSLQQFEPKAEIRFVSTADRVAFDYQMLEALTTEKLQQWTRADKSLDLVPLFAFSSDERRFWLRYYLLSFELSLTQPQLDEVEQAMFSSPDRTPCFNFVDGRLMRHQEGLYILPLNTEPQICQCVMGQKVSRQYDEITVTALNGSEIGNDEFKLKKRPDGAVITLPNSHSRKLKKWFNDCKIPLWWRDHLPYIYYQEELIAIGSLWLAPNFSDCVKVHWRPNGLLPWPQLD